MAPNIRDLPTTGAAERQTTHPRQSAGVFADLYAFFARMAATVGRLFTFTRSKSGAVPIVHADVALTPEGAAVWEQAMNPELPVGKPTRHRRRRLVDGDAT